MQTLITISPGGMGPGCPVAFRWEPDLVPLAEGQVICFPDADGSEENGFSAVYSDSAYSYDNGGLHLQLILVPDSVDKPDSVDAYRTALLTHGFTFGEVPARPNCMRFFG